MAAASDLTLFGRVCRLTVGTANDPNLGVDVAFNDTNSSGRDISGLAIEFEICRALKPTDPNNAVIRVQNLSPSSRSAMSGQHPISVKLEAGYGQTLSTLYFAYIRSASTVRHGPNFVSTIESQDTIARPRGVKATKKILGDETHPNGNVVKTDGPVIPVANALKTIARAMGVGPGNIQAALDGLKVQRLSNVNGGAVVGNAAQRMTDLCRSLGLEWSIQNGNLQLLPIGQTTGDQAIEISASTGMMGSPQVDSQGVLQVSTRLIPGLVPGALINMKSLFVSGGYRIEKIRYQGNTFGSEWDAHMTGTKY